MMIALLDNRDPAVSARCLTAVKREHAWWMEGDADLTPAATATASRGSPKHCHECPVYDAQTGCRCGSFDGNLRVHDRALRLTNHRTRIVAGHGGVTNKAEVAAYVAILRDVRTRAQAMTAAGTTREQVVAAKLLDGSPAVQPGGPDDRDAFVGTLYIALTSGVGR